MRNKKSQQGEPRKIGGIGERGVDTFYRMPTASPI